MTKKDYELIAKVLNMQKPASKEKAPYLHFQWKTIVAQFSLELKKSNPRFDRSRFLKACEIDE